MESQSSRRIMVFAAITCVVTLLVYWGASATDEWVAWSTLSAVLLGLVGLATGAAIGSARAINAWTTWEAVLVAVLAGVVGVIFWAWGLTVWVWMSVVKEAIPGWGMILRDLTYGAWFLAAILAPYIVRKPGAAIGAEMVGSIVSALLGSQWGLTVLLSGLAQGGLAEIVFAGTGYKRYDVPTLMVASCAAAIGSWIVDYALWYNTIEWPILIGMLVARCLSAMFFSGLVGKWLADALVRTGVLDNTALGRAANSSLA